MTTELTTELADKKNLVYDLMNGTIDLTVFTPAEDMNVENEFAEGSYCDKLYKEMLVSYESLCRRLGNSSGEDVDVETIISNLNEIGRHMSMKMYDYGMISANK